MAEATLDRALRAEEEVREWRERCRQMEAQFVLLEQSAADIKAAVERFQIRLNLALPKGIEKRA